MNLNTIVDEINALKEVLKEGDRFVIMIKTLTTSEDKKCYGPASEWIKTIYVVRKVY